MRDSVNIYAFHVPLTADAREVELDFDYLYAATKGRSRVEFSDAILDLQWTEVAMYPAGYFARDLQYNTTLKLPLGWKYNTALETASHREQAVSFQQTPLNTLADSPVFAGKFARRIDLAPAPHNPVSLDIYADNAAELQIAPERIEELRAMVAEAKSCSSRTTTGTMTF